MSSKDLYEVLVDLAIYIIVKLAGNQTQSPSVAQIESGDYFGDAVDASGDFLAHLVATFIKHVRQHEKLS